MCACFVDGDSKYLSSKGQAIDAASCSDSDLLILKICVYTGVEYKTFSGTDV